MSFTKKYVHNRSLFTRGNQEVQYLMSFFQQAILIWLFVRDLLSIPTGWVVYFVPAYFVVKFCVEWSLGRYFDRTDVISEEQRWYTERNPIFKKMEAMLKRIF